MALQQNHNYSAKDFERYYSGKMTEAEMHAIEKAALNDPFLSDALEGYQYANTPVEDVMELKEKLAGKNKKEVFIMRPKQWLRIAAMLVIIAAAGLTYYYMNFNSNEKVIAKNESQSKEAPLSKDTQLFKADVLKTDSIKSDVAFLSPLPRKAKERSAPGYNKSSIQKDEEVNFERDMVKSENNLTLNEKNNNYKAPVFSNNTRAPIAEGRVMDNNGNAIASATVRDNNRGTITVTDSLGFFRLPVYDSTATTTIAADGYRTKQAEVRNQTQQKIFLEDDRKDLSEVVITNKSINNQKKESKSPDRSLSGKVVAATVNPSEPVTGKEEFGKYLRDSVVTPANDKGEKYKGKVVLSFEVNKKGVPQKIKVEQPLCTPCDAEAKRLLESGPRWKYRKGRNVVEIKF